MKLLHIASESDDCIEEVLIFVPDTFDWDTIKEDIGDIVKEPILESVLILSPAPGYINRLDEYRPYFG